MAEPLGFGGWNDSLLHEVLPKFVALKLRRLDSDCEANLLYLVAASTHSRLDILGTSEKAIGSDVCLWYDLLDDGAVA